MYLLARDQGYGAAIAEFFNLSQNAVQKQLARLEEEGVIVSRLVGKVREYQLNPRYPFLFQLKELLKAALKAYPPGQQSSLLMDRKRPRQAGKPLQRISDK